jgi:urea transport system permease protein
MLTGSRLRSSGLAAGVFFLVFCFTASPAFSQHDDDLLLALKGLASDDSDVRRQTLSDLAASRDGRLVEFLQHYNQGGAFLWKDRIVVVSKFEKDSGGKEFARLIDPLTLKPLIVDGKPTVVPGSDVEAVGPSGRLERRVVADSIRLLEIWMPDLKKRLAAIQRFGDSRDAKFLKPLEQLLKSETPASVERKARDSVLLIRAAGNVPGQTQDDRLAAIRELGERCTARAVPLLGDLLKDATQKSVVHAACEESLAEIRSYQKKIKFLQNIFNGISLGSILILVALGLAIIFGQMGVINMAHGELMMIGAYATYEMQMLFGHSPDTPSTLYYIAAFPVAFLAAALVGLLIERLVVRHLYGRPLDTLLATWGVSLILIQIVRVKYGDNIGVNSPAWLVGSFEIMQDLVIPYNRAFILVLCAVCVGSVALLFQRTKLGLLIRATVQARETAGTLGVNTRRIDGYTFALGSGLAGIAGCAWTVVGGVTPDMGQNHIVDSFLVVVTGGVGKLVGSVSAGLGIGVLNKILEPATFGEGLLMMGLITTCVCWIVAAVRAFKTNRTLGWISLIPVPGPIIPAIKDSSIPGIRTAAGFYVVGILAVGLSWAGGHLIDWFGEGPFVLGITMILDEPVRSIWAKIMILICVAAFIQWRPMGLFPPKGRLADA